MWIRLKTEADPKAVAAELQGLGLWTRTLTTEDGNTSGFAVEPFSAVIDRARLAAVEGVAEVQAARSPHPKVDAESGKPARVADLEIGAGAEPVLMAGPCSIESEAQVEASAAAVAAAGGRVLRGGAFKPRTSPYSFAGHGKEALGWLRRAADRHGLAVVSEVMSEAMVDTVAEAVDLLQIGSRNMQNFALLRAAGAAGKPVMLKRGMAATVEEWLLAGEHLLAAGATDVIYCARGIAGFDRSTRNLLDIGAVALLTGVHGLPVVVDPSHAVGRRDLIPPMARAAMAAGASGLMIEIHPNPEQALSDGAQALAPEDLADLGWKR